MRREPRRRTETVLDKTVRDESDTIDEACIQIQGKED